MTRKFVVWSLLLLASQLVSVFVTSAIVYNEERAIRLAHIGFFTLMGTYIGYFVNRLEHDANLKATIEAVYKFSIIPFFIYFAYIGWHNASHRILISNFGFDDKSHAVFFCAFYAFLALKLLRGKYKFIISIIFILLSLMTISRLVVFFLPFYIVMFCWYAFKTRNAALRLIIIVLLISTSVFVAYQSSSFFHVFRRTAGGASGSTREHLDLIRATLLLKFENPSNLVFGIGAGNFGGIINMTDIESYMNNSSSSQYSTAGAAIPAHSTHAQILLEFSIVIVAVYFWFLWRIWAGNLRNKNFTELCFFVPLMGAVVFYSTHNEVLYWMMLLYLFAESVNGRKSRLSR